MSGRRRPRHAHAPVAAAADVGEESAEASAFAASAVPSAGVLLAGGGGRLRRSRPLVGRAGSWPAELSGCRMSRSPSALRLRSWSDVAFGATGAVAATAVATVVVGCGGLPALPVSAVGWPVGAWTAGLGVAVVSAAIAVASRGGRGGGGAAAAYGIDLGLRRWLSMQLPVAPARRRWLMLAAMAAAAIAKRRRGIAGGRRRRRSPAWRSIRHRDGNGDRDRDRRSAPSMASCCADGGRHRLTNRSPSVSPDDDFAVDFAVSAFERRTLRSGTLRRVGVGARVGVGCGCRRSDA